MTGSIYRTPTHDEINHILTRKNKLLLYHKRLHRKLRDIQGENYDSPKESIYKFKKFSYKYVGLSGLDSHLYYLYVILNIKSTQSRYDDIVSFVSEQGYISNLASSIHRHNKFDDTHEAVSWIIAYRGAMTYFNSKLRKLNYDSDVSQ